MVNGYTDHLGHEFATLRDMCAYWCIRVSTYNIRKEAGWDLKAILTEPTAYDMESNVIDHLGKHYVSVRAMCAAYDISEDCYFKRRQRGYTLEEALTLKVGERRQSKEVVTDHLGNTYSSVQAMCDAHRVSLATYRHRLKRGESLEKALQTTMAQDHLGNWYKSQTEMCRAYNIPLFTFKNRLRIGWSLEKALVVPYKESQCEDLNGRVYSNKKEMCEALGIPYAQFIGRLCRGYSIKDCLAFYLSKQNK